jgi:hypothetical protein
MNRGGYVGIKVGFVRSSRLTDEERYVLEED